MLCSIIERSRLDFLNKSVSKHFMEASLKFNAFALLAFAWFPPNVINKINRPYCYSSWSLRKVLQHCLISFCGAILLRTECIAQNMGIKQMIEHYKQNRKIIRDTYKNVFRKSSCRMSQKCVKWLKILLKQNLLSLLLWMFELEWSMFSLSSSVSFLVFFKSIHLFLMMECRVNGSLLLKD